MKTPSGSQGDSGRQCLACVLLCPLSNPNYAGANLYTIYLYLDGGSTELKSGLVLFDDFQIAGFTISITDLEAILIDSSKIDLHWQSSEPDKHRSF